MRAYTPQPFCFQVKIQRQLLVTQIMEHQAPFMPLSSMGRRMMMPLATHQTPGKQKKQWVPTLPPGPDGRVLNGMPGLTPPITHYPQFANAVVPPGYTVCLVPDAAAQQQQQPQQQPQQHHAQDKRSANFAKRSNTKGKGKGKGKVPMGFKGKSKGGKEKSKSAKHNDMDDKGKGKHGKGGKSKSKSKTQSKSGGAPPGEDDLPKRPSKAARKEEERKQAAEENANHHAATKWVTDALTHANNPKNPMALTRRATRRIRSSLMDLYKKGVGLEANHKDVIAAVEAAYQVEVVKAQAEQAKLAHVQTAPVVVAAVVSNVDSVAPLAPVAATDAPVTALTGEGTDAPVEMAVDAAKVDAEEDSDDKSDDASADSEVRPLHAKTVPVCRDPSFWVAELGLSGEQYQAASIILTDLINGMQQRTISKAQYVRALSAAIQVAYQDGEPLQLTRSNYAASSASNTHASTKHVSEDLGAKDDSMHPKKEGDDM